MDIYFDSDKPFKVEFVANENVVNLSSIRKLDVVFNKPKIDVEISRGGGLSLSAFANIIRGESVKRISQVEFDSLPSLKKDIWYFVTNTSGSRILKIYAGDTLFAEADKQGSIGFPYIFPLTF